MIRQTMQNTKAPSNKRRRRGMITMELVMTLPILLLFLMGLFEFSFLFYARGDVVEASRAGARLATMTGVHEEDIQAEVRRSFGHKYGSQVQVETSLGKYSGDEISVVVRVPMKAASPDLLWPVGYSLADRHLVAETRMIKE